MRFDVFTLFPGMFTGVISESIFKRAISRDIIAVHLHNIRDYAHDEHKTVDDYPYGGGSGMVMKPDPVFESVESVLSSVYGAEKVETGNKASFPIVLLTPQGRLFNQSVAREMAKQSHIILICGHYEGIDERIREHLVNDEISIGDYVLTGGEPAAIVVMDAVARLTPGVLGSEESIIEESHAAGLLEYPQYTRPRVYRGWEVPEILTSGNHAAIKKWRRGQSINRTARRRPDMLSKVLNNSGEPGFGDSGGENRILNIS
ncbi:MAG: tRNA (guanosine(37)-N1)-methyltransferase TrmD [Dehalococcoidia bacterium]|nr:tRNA (guanosine(37)-N1)-methyltransferase TrmD [Dehalococcoidia bacterium]MDZ4247283.1 tRNA (guanosine(37)-N1)-methyltransferase TrmD [Dehalococcoidia bacterium]